MARPQRNNVDYFPFICEEGTKMFYIEETYGNDGFAVFIKILRGLAKADYHYLDLSKKSTIMFLSAKCKVSVDTLESIVRDLVELDKFDAELWNENKIIWCQSFIDSIQDAYSKRSNNCIDKKRLILLLTSKGILKQGKGNTKQSLSVNKTPVNPHSIVEYNKTKETITKETIISRKLKFSQSTTDLFNCEFPNEIKHSNEFIDYWTEHGDKDKKMRFEKQSSFSTSRRIKTWIKNNFNNNGNKKQEKQTRIEKFQDNHNRLELMKNKNQESNERY